MTAVPTPGANRARGRPRGESRAGRTAGRIARGLAWTLLALFAAYLLVANVVLLTPLGPSLMSSGRVRVDYARGYSVVPGRIHLRDLTTIVDGARARWTMGAARVDATVAPLALLSGRLHAHQLTASDVRLRAEELGAGERRAPRTVARAPSLALVRRTERPPERWSLRVDDLRADEIRELSVAGVTFRGAARARGGFRYDREAGVRIEDARVDVLTGEVRRRDEPLVQNLEGRIELLRQEISPDLPTTDAWLSRVDGLVALEGAVPSANVIAGAAPSEYAGSGVVRASLQVEDGALARGSTLELHVPRTTLEGGPARARFSGDVALAVGAGGDASVRGTLRDVALAESRASDAALVVPELHVRGRAPKVRLYAPLDNAHVVAFAPELRGDLAALPVVEALVREGAGQTRGSAELVVKDGVATGTLTAHSDRIELELGDHPMVGSLDVHTELTGWDVGTDAARVRGEARFAGEGGGATATLRLPQALADVSEGTLLGRAALQMSSALPALDAITGSARLPDLIAIMAADRPVEGTAEVLVAPGHTVVEDIDASAGPLHVDGAIAVRDGERRATLLLEAGPFAVGVGVRGPETSFLLVSARSWFEEQMAEREEHVALP